MRKKLTHNLGLKISSILVAFLLWVVVVSVDDPVTSRPFTQIPVELTNSSYITDQGQVYEVQDGSDFIGITVTAKRSILDTLSRDNFKATADMTKIEGSSVPIEIKSTRYADKIENISLKSKTVQVHIENLIETQFNIQVTTQGTIADGCAVGDITLDKNVVKVSGPESIMEKVKGAQVSVNVSGMTSDISTSENIMLYDANGEVVDTSELTLSRDSVNIKVEIWTSKEVPIVYGYVGIPAAGYGATGEVTCSPSAIAITGKKDVLSKVSSVTIPSSIVDITGAAADFNKSVQITSYLPDGISLVSDDASTVVVQVGIKALSSKKVEIPITNLSVINVPEGLSAEIGGVGEVLAIEVTGMETALDTLDPLQITGAVDVSAITTEDESKTLSEGVYDAKVTMTYPNGIYGGTSDIMVKVICKKSTDTESDNNSNNSSSNSDSNTDNQEN